MNKRIPVQYFISFDQFYEQTKEFQRPTTRLWHHLTLNLFLSLLPNNDLIQDIELQSEINPYLDSFNPALAHISFSEVN